MAERRKRKKGKDKFLPTPGQGSDDPIVDAIVQCFVVIVELLWLFLSNLVWGIWVLLRYVLWDAYRNEEDK